MSDNTIADDLKAARALLEKGWCQHHLELDGSYCVLGAINMATDGSPTMDTRRGDGAYFAILQTLPAGVSVVDFNNAPDTTHDDVLNLFDKALADLGALA